jgi:hypothetical protein
MVAVIGLTIAAPVGAAQGHPNGWDTWKEYRRAHVDQLVERPEVMPTKIMHGSIYEEWERYLKQQGRLVRLRERWRDFDAAYQESLVADETPAASGSGTAPTTTSAPASSGGINWLAIADCESGDGTGTPPYTPNWYIDSTYDGGIQFDPETWWAYGGRDFAEYAYQATPSQQIAVGERVVAAEGDLGAWPICGAYG